MDAAVQQLINTLPNDPKLRSDFYQMMQSFIAMFYRYQREYQSGKKTVDWDRIAAPTQKELKDYSDLDQEPTNSEDVKKLLGQLIVVKLNGGLGTTMGCKGPKSVIEVRDGDTFLDLTIKYLQALNTKYGVDIPLVLMNSFNTEDDTRKIIQKYQSGGVKILCFNQKQYPRILKKEQLPAPTTANPSHINRDEWFPPGHGDVYDAFYHSDLFEYFVRQQGKRFMFLSNIDNLGATVDVRILNYLVKNDVDFCMEVTPKTRADVKGGTLIRYQEDDGRTVVKLLELASVPKDKVEEFKSIKKFKIFNTNNLWIKLPAIEQKLDQLNSYMDLIINAKVDDQGREVLQLETACGAAVQVFDKSMGVVVPRSRFLPVKACSDLLMIQSNLYTIADGSLVINPKRIEIMGDNSLPFIRLGEKYKKVGEYMDRIGHNVPDLLELEHLTVAGDVRFGKDCSLRGQVIVVAPEGSSIAIPDKTALENKVVAPGKDKPVYADHI